MDPIVFTRRLVKGAALTYAEGDDNLDRTQTALEQLDAEKASLADFAEVTNVKATPVALDRLLAFNSTSEPPFLPVLVEVGDLPGGTGGGSGTPVTISHNGIGELPVVGDTLAANFGAGWAGPVQWTRDGVDIATAVNPTYVVVEADEGTDLDAVIGDTSGLHYIASGFSIAVPGGGGGTPTLVQRSSAAPTRGVYAPGTAVFAANPTPGNTFIIYAASNASLANIGVVDSSQVGDVVEMFSNEVFGGAGYHAQLGYVENIVGGVTEFTMTSPDGVLTFYVEEWANLPAFNAAAGHGVAGAATPLAVSTPNATDVAVGVTFVVWTYFGNSLDGALQAVPAGFTEGARYASGLGGNEGRAQLIGAYRAETEVGVKTATWPLFVTDTFIATIIMNFGATAP